MTEEPGRRQRPRLLFLRASHHALACAIALFGLLPTVTMAQPAPAQVPGEIVIAAVATRANRLRPDGAAVVTGVGAAVDALNAGQTPPALPIRLVTYEDDCTSRGGEAVAGEIAAGSASLVVGHICSGAAVAAAAVYARRGILFISPGARSPRLTEPRAGPTIFRLAGRDDRFGADAARLIHERFHGQRVAIVNDKSVQARTLAEQTARALTTAGTKAAIREAYVNGEKEYNALVARLARDRIQVLVIPAQPIEAGIIFKGLIDASSTATLIGSDILAVPEMDALAGSAPGRLITLLSSARPAQAATEQRARAAVEAYMAARARTASSDPKSIGRALETEAAPTVLGPLRFDTKGDAIMPSYSPHVWRDGDWHSLQP